jgi:hypothetical protein
VTDRIEVHDLTDLGSGPWPDVMAAVGGLLSARPSAPMPH